MPMEPRFTAHIVHTADTVDRLYRTAHRAYGEARVLARMALGVVLAICGLTAALSPWVKALLLLSGTWLLSGLDFGSSMRASDAVERRGGNLPRMDYAFFEDHMTLEGEGSMSIPYARLDRLVWDEGYFYLFLAHDSVCMLDRATVQGGAAEDFPRFLQERTGKRWRRDRTLLTMTVRDAARLVREKWAERGAASAFSTKKRGKDGE